MADIQFPAPAEVERAIAIWSADDSRLVALLTRYGDPVPALRHYGLVLWGDGNLQTACQALTGAAALNPGDPHIWSDLAGVFGALGHIDQATACIEVSLARDPRQPQIWLRLGAMQTARGNGPASIEAYRKALDLDDSLIEAQLGLGVSLIGAKRFGDAVAPLRAALAHGKADEASVRILLGQALDGSGDFEGAAAQFRVAHRLQPDNRETLIKMARAQFIVDAINGTAEDALAACERLSLSTADVDKTMSDAFHLLSAYDHRRAAIQVGELRLARQADDAIQTYLLGTLKGEPMDRAPDGYIVSFFDLFADEFEHKLVDVLGYRVPDELAALTQMVAHQTGHEISRILDLGCGTGLAGARLAQPLRRLTGVDLSPRMLEKARRLGCYHSLIEAEAAAFLEQNRERYDLVVAADMLIYFGELARIFSAVAQALNENGLFALSIETAPDGSEILHLPSGRFAHGVNYVEHVAKAAGFTVRVVRRVTIRLDAKGPAQGALFLLSKD